ncbi:MAG: polyphosphate kinase 1 [Planctomycetota bacterium]
MGTTKKKNGQTTTPAQPRAPIARAAEATTSSSNYLNRDLSWLEFNRRVLFQALDPGVPLLERVKFCAIFSNNLDEFVMKRIGFLRADQESGDVPRGPDGLPPSAVLAECRARIADMQATLARCWDNELVPALAAHDIHILTYADLGKKERKRADEWFNRNVFPVLTPLAVDKGHRFPFISNLSESLGVLLERDQTDTRAEEGPSFARLKIPDVLPRFVPLEEGDRCSRFLPLDALIEENLDDLFPGLKILGVTPFRITRSAAPEKGEDDENDDLLEQVQEELHLRRFAEAVRLEFNERPHERIRELITEELKLETVDIYERSGPLEYRDLFELASLPRADLREDPWRPVTPPALADDESDIFATIAHRDILVHHPYESFERSVERFIAAAARDPDVLAIKQTIYRTSRDSPFVRSLIKAAEAGKAVACLVELRARFDEERNVEFARQLEQHGVHVAYGVVGLKTHSKCSLVVRREGKGLRSYAHLGTGNYHPDTATLYTDLGVLTANTEITGDVIELFNELTGHSGTPRYKRLLVAPHHMRRRFADLIESEIKNAKQGKPARIVAKFNSLEDRRITEHLYKASNAGVPVTLIVRGFCCLRPGVPGLSENISVISIVGRFLEHSRIFHFAAGHEDPVDGEWYIGSADWMYRNLNNRVEAQVPILDREARARLQRMIDVQIRDHRHAWDLRADGSYSRREVPKHADPLSPESLGTFETLMRDAAASRSEPD